MSEDEPVTALVLLSTFIRQCSSQFSSSACTIVDPAGLENTIFTENGDVCISPEPMPAQEPPEFTETVSLTANGNDDTHEQLQNLTNELKEISESALNIAFDGFEAKWGISVSSRLPFLIEANGKFESDFENLPQIALCLALEVSVEPEPGQCITPDRVCVGSDFSVQRKKVTVYRVRKFFENALDSDEIDRIANFVVKKMSEMDPAMLLKSVPCCRHCFRLYSRVPTGPARPKTTAVSRGVTALQMTGSAQSSARTQRTSWGMERKKQDREAIVLERREFAPFRKTKSGLTIIQDTSARTHRKAYALYSIGPFPPFRQHK